MIIYFNFRSSIKESYNIKEEKHSINHGDDYSNNNVKIENVLETDDGQPDTVDDLHPLIDQEVLTFLKYEDHLHGV